MYLAWKLAPGNISRSKSDMLNSAGAYESGSYVISDIRANSNMNPWNTQPISYHMDILLFHSKATMGWAN